MVTSEEATLPYTTGGRSCTAEPEREPEPDAYGDHSDDAPPKKPDKTPPEEATKLLRAILKELANLLKCMGTTLLICAQYDANHQGAILHSWS